MKKTVPLIHAGLVLVTALIALRICGLLQKEAAFLSLRGVLCYLIPVITAFILYWLYQCRYGGKDWDKEKKIKKERGSYYIVAAGGIFLVLNLLSLSDQDFEYFNTAVCGYLILSCFMTGIFEEIIFRGLILRLFQRFFSLKKRRIFAPVVCSSAVFALVHLLNLIERPDFILGTFTQVIYTFCLGMLLGTSYFIRGSLYKVIFLHSIFNFMGQINVVFQKNMNVVARGDISMQDMLIQLVIMLPCAVIAVKMLKGIKKEDR